MEVLGSLGLVILIAGFISLVFPLRFLGIRSKGTGALVAAVGFAVFALAIRNGTSVPKAPSEPVEAVTQAAPSNEWPPPAPTEDELKAFGAWFSAVKEEFEFYRHRENEILDLMLDDSSREPFELPYNRHNDLMPSWETRRKLAVARYEDMGAADICRMAIRGWAHLRAHVIEGGSSRDSEFLSLTRSYVDGARECEKDLKLKPLKSKLREYAR